MSGEHKRQTRIKKAIFFLTVFAVLLALLIVALSVEMRHGRYLAFDQPTEGGKPQNNPNLASIQIAADEKKEDVTKLSINFISGSQLMGVETCGVPEYQISFLTSPLRMAVTFTGLMDWEYVINGVPQDPTGLISGMFQVAPMTSMGELTLYFHLTKEVEYRVKTTADGTLNVFLKAGEPLNDSGWYVVCDRFYQMQDGTLPDCGLTPTLCDDKLSVLLISGPFENEAQANIKKNELLAGPMADTTFRVQELRDDTLISYTETMSEAALMNESIMSVNGAKISLPLFFADARFLTWLPDGSAALFAKDENDFEQLYIADKEGRKELLVEQKFQSITRATFSGDGSTLFLVDREDGVDVISSVNMTSKKITLIGSNKQSELFSRQIVGIAANRDGSKLYVISGEDTYKLVEYDGKQGTIYLLAQDLLIETDIVFNNGNLYYCDVVDEWEVIVSRNVEENEREIIAKGSSFRLSGDGKTVAVLTEDYESAVIDLSVVNLKDMSKTIVKPDVLAEDMFFSADNRVLYYITETGDEEFYYELMAYDMTSGTLAPAAQSINGSFFASNTGREVIVSIIYNGKNGLRPATYIADSSQAADEREEFRVEAQ